MRKLRSSLCIAAIAVLAMSVATAPAATRYWDGGTIDIDANGDGVSQGSNGDWDTTILNWDQGAGLAHVAWNNAAIDDAVITNAAASNQTLTLQEPITVGDLTVAVTKDTHFSNSTLTLAGTGGTAGTSLINWTKNGNFNCVLAGTNGFTIAGSGNPGFNSGSGNTISGPGYLEGNVQFRLKSSELAIQNVTSLTVNGTSQLYLESSNGTRTYNTPLFMNSSSSSAIRFDEPVTWAGNITLLANTNIDARNSAASITGTIGESGGSRNLTLKYGSSTAPLTLAAANTYTGLTSVLQSVLAYGIDNAILTGGITVNGGMLDIGTYSDTVGTVTLTKGKIAGTTGVLSSAADFAVKLGTVSARLGGSNGLTKTGNGLVILSGDNGYTGATTVDGGTLQFISPSAIAGTGQNVTVNAGAGVAFGPSFGSIQDTLNTRIDTASTGAIALAADSSENLDFNTAGLTAARLGAVTTATYTGTLTPNGGIYRLGGGGGTLTMGNTNALTGADSLVVSGKVVLPTANNMTGTTTINSSATLQLGTGVTGQNGSVLSPSIVNNGSLIFNNGDAQAYGDVISGGGPLTKTGAGTLALTGADTYGGNTYVNGGTLEVSGASGSISASNSYTLSTTLELINVDSTEGAVNRLRNDRDITGKGGTFKYTNTAGTGQTYAEQIRNLTANTGQTDVVLTNDMTTGGNTQTLTMGTLGKSNRGTVTLSTPAGLDATTNRIVVSNAVTPAGQIAGPWATVGTAANAQSDYAIFDASKNVVPANIAASAETTWTTATDAYTMEADGTLTGTRTITALRHTGAAHTLNLGANDLETYGILNGGSGLLTINGTGAIKQQGTSNANVYLTAGVGDITINAPITNNTGALSLVKSGPGTATLAGAVALNNGITEVNAGTLVFSGSSVALGSNGDINVNAGATFTQSAATLTARYITVGTLGSAPAVMNHTGGTSTLSEHLYVGKDNTGNGGSPAGHVLNVTGGTIDLGSKYLYVGGNSSIGGGTGTLNISGAGTVVQATTSSNHFDPGRGVGSVGYINQSGGTLKFTYNDWGNGGSAVGYQTGGTYIPKARLAIGHTGTGTSSYTITGGLLDPVGSTPVGVGANGTLSVLSGGTYTGPEIHLGGSNDSASGTLNIATGATVNTNVGVNNYSVSGVSLNKHGSTAHGVLNLAGGQLNMTGGISGTAGGTGTINLNGGTIQYQKNASQIPYSANYYSYNETKTWMGGFTHAYVFPGGVTVDTMTFTGGFSQDLEAATGSGVTGVTLVGSGAGYTAAPAVSFTGGTLVGAGLDAEAVATFDRSTGLVTGIVIVNPGQYSALPTGVVLSRQAGALDTWATAATASIGSTASNSGGGLTKTGTGTLTLTGDNTYNGDTIVQEGTLSITTAGIPWLDDDSAVKILGDGTSAFMNLDFNGESDTIAELWLSGVEMAPGTYNKDDATYGDYFTGDGSLLVVAGGLTGDADENGVVNAADYMALKRNMGTSTSATLAMGNFDTDQDVDYDDLQLLIGNYDAVSGGAPAVPEPATLFVLLAAGLPALLKRRRSRS